MNLYDDYARYKLLQTWERATELLEDLGDVLAEPGEDCGEHCLHGAFTTDSEAIALISKLQPQLGESMLAFRGVYDDGHPDSEEMDDAAENLQGICAQLEAVLDLAYVAGDLDELFGTAE